VDTPRLMATGLACRHTPRRVFGCSAPGEDAGRSWPPSCGGTTVPNPLSFKKT